MSVKDKIASGLGSVLEWYDFSLYGFFAPLLAQLFFPSDAPATGLLKTFSIFAIGFLARPIGALIFGYISDKYGRTVSLKLTPLLITCPTPDESSRILNKKSVNINLLLCIFYRAQELFF